jgi:hypothetical protein
VHCTAGAYQKTSRFSGRYFSFPASSLSPFRWWCCSSFDGARIGRASQNRSRLSCRYSTGLGWTFRRTVES